VNMYAAGGDHLFWQTYRTFPVNIANMWLETQPGFSPWASFGYWVYPQVDGKTFTGAIDTSRRAVLSGDGQSLWFIGSNITGTVRKGIPSGGDFVPRSLVGTSYVSPGY